MSSIPPSPVTPSHLRRQRLSEHDFSATSVSPYRSNRTPFSRRSSHTSQSSLLQRSPVTPRRLFSYRRKSDAMSASSIPVGQTTNGFDSLADELGEIWDEDGGDDQGSSFLDGLREGSVEAQVGEEGFENSFGAGDLHDFGFGISMLGSNNDQRDLERDEMLPRAVGLKPLPNGSSRTLSHPRLESQDVGTVRGQDADHDDADTLSPGLETRMSDIESLARMSMASDGLNESDSVFSRTTATLQDLGAQSSLENNTTKLITAYTSMSMHRTHNTKELFSQSQALLFTPYPTLLEEMIDQVLPEVEDLLCCIPFTQAAHTNPLSSLHSLISNTGDLIFSLQSLSDILQESKVVTSTASRRLKGVKDLVKEMRLEEEAREEGVRWIDRGNWDQRLREREAGSICRDVVGGFEKTCDMWRERLVVGAEAEIAASAGAGAGAGAGVVI